MPWRKSKKIIQVHEPPSVFPSTCLSCILDEVLISVGYALGVSCGRIWKKSRACSGLFTPCSNSTWARLCSASENFSTSRHMTRILTHYYGVRPVDKGFLGAFLWIYYFWGLPPLHGEYFSDSSSLGLTNHLCLKQALGYLWNTYSGHSKVFCFSI